MANPAHDAEPNGPSGPLPDDGGSKVGADVRTTVGAPRCVKVLGIIALAAAALVVVLLLVGGGTGGHRPGRHTLSPAAPAGRGSAAALITVRREVVP